MLSAIVSSSEELVTMQAMYGAGGIPFPYRLNEPSLFGSIIIFLKIFWLPIIFALLVVVGLVVMVVKSRRRRIAKNKISNKV